MIVVNTIGANDSERSEGESLSWEEFLEKGDKFIIEVSIKEGCRMLQLIIIYEKGNHNIVLTVYDLILKKEKLQMT